MSRTTPARALSPLPDFPASLTWAERRALDALIEHGGQRAAAAAMGRAEKTINQHISIARDKAGAAHTLALVLMYVQAGCA